MAKEYKLSPQRLKALQDEMNYLKTVREKEVAELIGISQSYISRLEKRIILRLRREIVKMS